MLISILHVLGLVELMICCTTMQLWRVRTTPVVKIWKNHGLAHCWGIYSNYINNWLPNIGNKLKFWIYMYTTISQNKSGFISIFAIWIACNNNRENNTKDHPKDEKLLCLSLIRNNIKLIGTFNRRNILCKVIWTYKTCSNTIRKFPKN